MKKIQITGCLLFLFLEAAAKITLPGAISDNMVLQQETQVKIWGWTKKKAAVSVKPSWSDVAIKTTAKSDGSWIAKITTPKGDYTARQIEISDGDSKVTLSNILIGEVWLASGQSNMEMPLGGFYNCPTENANDEILNAGRERNNIRYYNVPAVQSYTPTDSVGGCWEVPSSKNAATFSATAYFFARNLNRVLDVPVGIIESSWGGSPIESWLPRPILETYPDVDLRKDSIYSKFGSARPMVMYNAMIHPVRNYTLKGFIWYQGEANIYPYKTYAQRMNDMVNLWRSLWKKDLPFYYVEIAPFDYGIELSQFLREAQYEAQTLIANSGMVSTNDLVYDYERVNIHPSRKEEVGKRLSYFALKETYHIQGVHDRGPEYRSVEFKDGKAYVQFANAEGGFNRMCDIVGFEICGDDRKFYPAEARADNGGVVVVENKNINNPIAVRYCFHDFMVGNLANTFGLPVVPFRTDAFEK